MSSWLKLLDGLAEEYHQRLSVGELNRRLSHHICHVASEQWLAQEFAYLINAEGASVGLEGWKALMELRRVDVTLMPPVGAQETGPIYLEFKAVPPDYWSNWHEVYHDLACHPVHPPKREKPAAHFAVCFLVDSISPGSIKRRSDTTEKYRQYMERIPSTPGPFQPIEGLPALYLEHTSPPFRACWPYSVPGHWPAGYESTVRILWVAPRS